MKLAKMFHVLQAWNLPGGRPTWGVSPGGAQEEEKRDTTFVQWMEEICTTW